jgi:ABC-2 type transport system ATP-binding protein
MNRLEIQNISKSYQDKKVLDNISFNIPKGSIFGLLGPNGAGKTTLLRIITGIFASDEGTVKIDGKLTDLLSNSATIGYMPEERGLYKKMKVEEQAIYLAQLKGMSYSDAKKSVSYWIERLGMQAWKHKKLEELSKGMGQKLQFVCTVVHNPNLIILDEPFTGLDPLNADLIKNEIYELAKNGATILFSTHRMEQVEEICQQIVLINQGKMLLHSDVKSAKKMFLKNEYIIEGDDLTNLKLGKTFELIEHQKESAILKINESYTYSQMLHELADFQITFRTIRENLPSLNKIFIELVNQN